MANGGSWIPLSESGFVGRHRRRHDGLRPVVEMQFADFISCAFDQITEVAAKITTAGGSVPLVIRAPFGGASMEVRFILNVRKAGSFIRPASKSLRPRRPMTPKVS